VNTIITFLFLAYAVVSVFAMFVMNNAINDLYKIVNRHKAMIAKNAEIQHEYADAVTKRFNAQDDAIIKFTGSVGNAIADHKRWTYNTVQKYISTMPNDAEETATPNEP
jgi:hypothetical protein